MLLALPWLEPAMARAEVVLLALWHRMRARRTATTPAPAASRPVPGSVLAAPRVARDDDTTRAREAVGVGGRSGASAVRSPEGWPHHPARPHTVRSERTPVTPAGSRRPPHSDRLPRTNPPLSQATGRGRGSG